MFIIGSKNLIWKVGIAFGIVTGSLALISAYHSHSDAKARDLFYTQEMYRFSEHSSYLISCWLGTNEYGITMDNEEFGYKYKKNNEDIEALKKKMHQGGYDHWEITKIEKAAQQVLKEQKDFVSTNQNAVDHFFESPEAKLLHPEGTHSPGTVISELFSNRK